MIASELERARSKLDGLTLARYIWRLGLNSVTPSCRDQYLDCSNVQTYRPAGHDLPIDENLFCLFYCAESMDPGSHSFCCVYNQAYMFYAYYTVRIYGFRTHSIIYGVDDTCMPSRRRHAWSCKLVIVSSARHSLYPSKVLLRTHHERTSGSYLHRTYAFKHHKSFISSLKKNWPAMKSSMNH